MTLLEDLERHAEEKEDQKPDIIRTILDSHKPIIPEWRNPENGLSHPGSTGEPSRLVFFSEAFVA